MSLVQRVLDLSTEMAAAVKADRMKINGNAADLSGLTTTNKTSLMAAINEVNAAAAAAASSGGAAINDSATAASTTWSSQKISSSINAAVPTWATLSGKPATFPPTIGTTATTAKAGDYVPAWGEITSKPTFATVATSGAYTDLSGRPTLAAVATSGAYADLTGVIPTSALPPLAINEVFTAASQTAMLALTAQRGDMVIRTDTSTTYVLASDSPSTLADWKVLAAPDQVTSVAGRTGAVSLTKADVGLSNVDNTSDAAKPISTATQTALNAKAVIGTAAGTAQDASLIGNPETDFVATFRAALA